MGDLAVLGVIVDPTGAESGSVRAGQAMQRMSQAATQAEQTINRSNQNTVSSHRSVGEAVDKAGDKVTEMAKRFAEFALAAAGVNGVLDLLKSSVTQASNFEQMTFQLSVLTGSLGKARTEMAAFQQFANATSFELPDVAKAGKYVHLFDPAIASAKDMQHEIGILGDAASVAGQPIADVAFQYERLKQEAANGGSIGEASESLRHMGVLTAQTVIQLQNADRFGFSASQKIALLEQGMSRTAGATERANNLFETQRTTLLDTWTTLRKEFGAPLMESLKPVLAEFTDGLTSDVLPAAKTVGAEISRWIDLLNGAQKAGQLQLGVSYVGGNMLGSLNRAMSGSGPTGGPDASLYAQVNSTFHGFVDVVGNLGSVIGEDFKTVHVAVEDAGAHFLAYVTAAGTEFNVKLTNFFADNAIGRRMGFHPVADTGLTGAYQTALQQIRTADGLDANSLTRQYQRGEDANERLKQSTSRLGQGFTDLYNTIDKLGTSFEHGYQSGAGGQLGTGLQSSLPLLLNPLTTGLGAFRATLDGTVDKFDAINAKLAASANGFTSTHASVFGRNMDGSIDRTDEAFFMQKYGAVTGMQYAHQGAYNDPSTGSAYDLTQASGVALPYKVSGADPGFVLMRSGGNAVVVPVIDRGPSDAQVAKGYGIDATPDVLRSLGAHPGDAVSYQRFGSKEAAWAAMGEQAKGGYALKDPQSNSIPLDDLTKRFLASGQAKFGTDDAALKSYNDTVTQLDYLLRGVDLGNKHVAISQDEYNQKLAQAQDKLTGSVSDWHSLTGRISEAAVAQARYNEEAARNKRMVDLGVATPGQAIGYGATSWAHEQGNTDQQLAKLTSDSLGAATNDVSTFFESWSNGSQSAGQAFKQFTASIAGDIAKMIERMLVLKAVQTAIGFFGGGGTSEFGSAAGTGFSQGEYNDIWGAATVGTQHTGGMVGNGSFGSTSVSPAAFVGAPRFHSGGMLGLGPDEEPIVALKGERVLNRQETMAYNRGGGSSPVINIPVTINPSSDQAGGSGGLDAAASNKLGKTLEKRIRAMVKEETHNATRYRGMLNPG